MIALTPLYKNIWKATGFDIEFNYAKDTEYVDVAPLTIKARRKECLPMWLATQNAQALVQGLRDCGFVPTQSLECAPGTTRTFIHPSLVPHLATWLHPKFNYPVCKLLQTITNNARVEGMHEAWKARRTRKPTTHCFTFAKLNDKHESIMKYKAVECMASEVEEHLDVISRFHPNLKIIFQQFEIPNGIRVLDQIKKDWMRNGNIAVTPDNMCATDLAEHSLCNFLRKLCPSDIDPAICEYAYDVVDCKYEEVV